MKFFSKNNDNLIKVLTEATTKINELKGELYHVNEQLRLTRAVLGEAQAKLAARSEVAKILKSFLDLKKKGKK